MRRDAGCDASVYVSTPASDKKTKFISANDCATCHPAEYREWRTSMHAYAQHSPIFLAFTKTVLINSGGTLGPFCVRCHTPEGVAMGESAILPNDDRHELALESVTCVACHGAHTRDGQASAVYHVPIPGQGEPTIYGPFYGYDEPNAPNDPSMRLIKSPHVSRYRAYITESRFCGQCHDVILNDGTRIEEAFSEWKNSPYARRGVTCQACHMSPNPGKPVPFTVEPIVDSDLFPDAPARPRTTHLFTGPDYSILKAFGQKDLGLNDAEFKAHTAALEKDRLTLMQNGCEMSVSAPANARPGEKMKVEVTVTNTGAGHNFPTGFTAERQFWIEIIVTDAKGTQLYSSGDLDGNKDLRNWESTEVEDGVVPLDWDLANYQASFVIQNFKGSQLGNISTVNRLLTPAPFVVPATTPASLRGFGEGARVFKRGIPALTSKTASYSIRIPKDSSGSLSLSVTLHYRNLPPNLLAGLGIPDSRPKLRILDVKTYQAKIALEP
jgi:cytochrome c554/c'-like protein